MILEKIKEHGGKIMFFAVNILLIVAGVFFIKQKNTEEKNIAATEADIENNKLAADYAAEIQAKIIADEQARIKSFADDTAAAAIVPEPTPAEVVTIVEPAQELKISETSKSVPSQVTPVVALPPAVVPKKIDGKCGSADSSAKRGNSNCDEKAPSSNLCKAGSASAIKFKPNKYDLGWNWTCEGQNGGASAKCRCS